MAVEFFSTDPQAVSARVAATFDAMRDEGGSLLFPDHRRAGTPGYNLRNLIVQEVLHWHREANAGFSIQSPMVADGPYLEEWAKFFDKPRGTMRPATGDVVLEAKLVGSQLVRLFGTRIIPEGTMLSSANDQFVLLQAVEIPEGEKQAYSSIQALTPGPGTKLATGAALTVEFGQLRNVLTATTTTPVEGGMSDETDAELRYRLVRALIDPTTFEGYRTTVLSHPDVSNAQLSNGVYGPGTLEAFVVPAITLPTRSLRDELENLWQGAGNVYVVFPDYEGVQMQIRTAGAVNTEVIANYINNLPLGQALTLNAIEALIQNNGATDAQVIALRRGSIDLDGDLADPEAVRQVTNLSPRSPRSKWHTRPEWITLCEA